MTLPPRLPAPYGRFIQQSNEISFSFEGDQIVGVEGDTIGSALLGSGRKTVSRSFKYHRPRGFLSFSGFDANGYVQVGDLPNIIADTYRVHPGMSPVEGQNRAGTVEHDRSAWMNFMKRFLPVGFYYRSFFTPSNAWPFFEKIFRAKAGLGQVNKNGEHQEKDKKYSHADVAIVGGGAAGISAAIAAAKGGADIVLIEMMPRLGGAALYDNEAQYDKIQALIGELEKHDNIRVLTDAFAQGLFEDNLLSVEASSHYEKIRAKAIILATGAYEQPIIFRNNDLPGIMLSSAARRLIWMYGVKPGTEAVIATINDLGLETALQLAQAGVKIKAVADLRPETNNLHNTLRNSGVDVYIQSAPYDAFSSNKGSGFYFGGPIEAVQLCKLSNSGEPTPLEGRISCDLLIMSGGYVPAAGLACHGGARLQYDETLDTFHPDSLKAGVFLAGQANNIFGEEQVRDSAKTTAAKAVAFALARNEVLTEEAPPSCETINHPFPIIPHPNGNEFVDFDEDLTIKDIENAISDGFALGELLKRYSTAGMGPSQGRQAAVNVLRIAARKNGIAPKDMGTTTVRPPLRGESFANLAGPHFHPTAFTPIQERHKKLGGTMMPAGAWMRPAYYGPEASSEKYIAAEAEAVRNNVGLIDVSTLGKIEVMGPDAARFLDRVYLTTHSSQQTGRSRYAIRCSNDGSIVDDGVICRFGDDNFYVTTTSGQATPSYRHMTWLNAQWQMNVQITNVTGAYGAINIAGPKSRDVVLKITTDIDFSSEAFPYIACRSGTLAGAPVRIVRVGFVGELGYELHVPSLYAASLWDLLLEAGEEFNIKPFGVLTQRLLRLEKGHVIVGQDTDGLTTPQEASMSWAIPKKKQDYWGAAALKIRSNRPLERTLTGFKLLDKESPVPPECTLIIQDDEIVGRITSAARSHCCQGIIGLCFISPELNKEGSTFEITLPNKEKIAAKIVPTPFYDPKNERQAQ